MKGKRYASAEAVPPRKGFAVVVPLDWFGRGWIYLHYLKPCALERLRGRKSLGARLVELAGDDRDHSRLRELLQPPAASAIGRRAAVPTGDAGVSLGDKTPARRRRPVPPKSRAAAVGGKPADRRRKASVPAADLPAAAEVPPLPDRLANPADAASRLHDRRMKTEVEKGKRRKEAKRKTATERTDHDRKDCLPAGYTMGLDDGQVGNVAASDSSPSSPDRGLRGWTPERADGVASPPTVSDREHPGHLEMASPEVSTVRSVRIRTPGPWEGCTAEVLTEETEGIRCRVIDRHGNSYLHVFEPSHLEEIDDEPSFGDRPVFTCRGCGKMTCLDDCSGGVEHTCNTCRPGFFAEWAAKVRDGLAFHTATTVTELPELPVDRLQDAFDKGVHPGSAVIGMAALMGWKVNQFSPHKKPLPPAPIPDQPPLPDWLCKPRWTVWRSGRRLSVVEAWTEEEAVGEARANYPKTRPENLSVTRHPVQPAASVSELHP